MDPIYQPAYASEMADLLNVSPDRDVYLTIASMVERADYSSAPKGILRVDAMFFLVLNMGAMIVIPWQRTHKQNFFSNHSKDLEADVLDIVTESKQIASQGKVPEISANLLVQVTGRRKGGNRTRGLNIWGP